jgi:hypothetical protein
MFKFAIAPFEPILPGSTVPLFAGFEAFPANAEIGCG